MNNQAEKEFLTYLAHHHTAEIAGEFFVLSKSAVSALRNMSRERLDALETTLHSGLGLEHVDEERRPRLTYAISGEIGQSKMEVLPPHVVLQDGPAKGMSDDLTQGQAHMLANKLNIAVVLVPEDEDDDLDFYMMATPNGVEVEWVLVDDELRYGALDVSMIDALDVLDGKMQPTGDATLLLENERLPFVTSDLATTRMPRHAQLSRAGDLARDDMTMQFMAKTLDARSRVSKRLKEHLVNLESTKQEHDRDSGLTR